MRHEKPKPTLLEKDDTLSSGIVFGKWDSLLPQTFQCYPKNPDGGEEIVHRSPLDIMAEITALDAEVAKCWRLFGGCCCNRKEHNSMTEDTRWKQRYDNYKRALYQLTLAVQLMQQRPLSDLELQGLIQGFEFTHELAWNVLKDYLEMEGIQGLIGSRSTVREAFKRGLIIDGEAWMDMIEKRNLSSHTYNQDVAATLVSAIYDSYYPAFMALQERFEKEI
jgi:nucleotidyltransferase substrate binding protein (TIGR01987 family)